MLEKLCQDAKSPSGRFVGKSTLLRVKNNCYLIKLLFLKKYAQQELKTDSDSPCSLVDTCIITNDMSVRKPLQQRLILFWATDNTDNEVSLLKPTNRADQPPTPLLITFKLTHALARRK